MTDNSIWKNKSKRRATGYAVWYFSPILLALICIGSSYLILRGFGETVGPVEAALLQEETPQRYRSSIAYRPRPYKIQRTKLRSRETLIVGSSRVMQFISAPWKDQATNAGGAIRDIESAEIFFEEILPTFRPKRIILGIDWWWFATNRLPDILDEVDPNLRLSLVHYQLPFRWLSSGTLSLSTALQSITNPTALPIGIGYFAKYGYSGWDAFGHYDYGLALSRRTDDTDVGFSKTLKEVQSPPRKNYKHPAAKVSENAWQRFGTLVENLQALQIDVIVFVPPVAPAIAEWTAAQPEPNLVNEVRRRLTTLNVRYYDFHDPSVLGISPCEFLDGQHAGEVANLRVLRSIAMDERNDLGTVVDLDLLNQLISENEGRASIRSSDPHRPPEMDFLKIGCTK